MIDDMPMAPTAPIVEMSDNIDAIAKVLPQAQAAMGEVFKNANNPAFKSRYADLASVVEAVLPALNSHGISLLQPSAYDGEMARISTMLLHESGQWVRCTLSVPLTKRDAHGLGSAVTYGRRFGLQAMSGVAPTDDDGNAAAKAAPKRSDLTPANASEPPTGGRKIAAQAKRDGDDAKIKADIAQCSREGLRDWHENFDAYTAHLPLSWLDSVRDMLEHRLEDLNGGPGVDPTADDAGELDEAYRQTVAA